MQMKPLDNIGIGKKIQQYRKSFRMSQESFAEELGVAATVISRIENGRKSNLTIDFLMEIAGVFGITINDLCYDTAGSPPENKEESLRADQKEAASILERLSDSERTFLMKMIRGII